MIRYLRVWFAARVLRYADHARNRCVSWAIGVVARHATEAERTAVVEERLRSPQRVLALVINQPAAEPEPSGSDEGKATQPPAEELPN